MSESNVDAPPGLAAFAAFWVGDAILLAAAWLVFQQAHRPMVLYEVVAVACCTALAAGLGVWPFLLRQRAVEAQAERDQVTDTLGQLQRLEELAERIGLATSQWQTAQEHATNAVTAAREIADRMTEEQRQFREFLQQSQTARVQHLELEAAKLRRTETEWLQVAVRTLDHVFALYLAATRSGQPHLAEQIGAFQHACREVARRVGLVAHVATPGMGYDANAHQMVDPNDPVPEDPVVAATLGPGYTFQGQVLRRVVVAVQSRSALDAELAPVSGDGVALSSNVPSSPEPAAAMVATSWDGRNDAGSGDDTRAATALSFTTARTDNPSSQGA